jgi:hypothetical protein
VEDAGRLRYTNASRRLEDVRRGKVYGLRLTLAGAAATPHSVDGFPGHLFWTDRVTPVGGQREPSVEDAMRADHDPGCQLELVELSQSDILRERANHSRPTVDGDARDDPLVAALLAERLGPRMTDNSVRNVQRHSRRARALEAAAVERFLRWL